MYRAQTCLSTVGTVDGEFPSVVARGDPVKLSPPLRCCILLALGRQRKQPRLFHVDYLMAGSVI